MTQEVFELVKRMDIRAVETQILLRCTPLIAGLKPSNLLIIRSEQTDAVRQLLCNTRFSCCLLYCGRQKAVLLLYTDRPLKRCLEQQQVRSMLEQFGYRDFGFQALLSDFAGRYQAYMQGQEEFPHEMGLFLGYPPEDVRGFLENQGENALYTGYWKVYQNKAEKIRLFDQFDQVKETLIRLAAEGVSISRLLGTVFLAEKY